MARHGRAALLHSARIPGPYVLVAESSATLDARVFTAFYPLEVTGLVMVDAVHPDLLTSTGRIKRSRLPEVVGHSQDVMARVFNQLGVYRLGPRRVAQPQPKGLTESEWSTVWRLAQSSKARSALLQDISVWQQSNLGDRPLVVVSSSSALMALQTELVGLSTRGKQVVLDESGELIYREPATILEAIRGVLGR